MNPLTCTVVKADDDQVEEMMQASLRLPFESCAFWVVKIGDGNLIVMGQILPQVVH